MAELRLIPLGGMGNVTQNMYVYEYGDEILIVDCGIGFPDVYMPGVDSLIPDISYLLKQLEAGKKIVGMVLSHGHDDHIGALPYILPELPEFPIYAAPLTAGFANQRITDKGEQRNITVLKDKVPVQIGQAFRAMFVAMSHSVPDTKHVVIDTPEGLVYHGSDFKLDPAPVDGVLPDFATVEQLGNQGVMLMLIDSLRIERTEPVASESKVGPVLEELMAKTQGKFVVTLMSSHIHRIQQICQSAAQQDRKVVLVGRSVEQNVKVSRELGKLTVPNDLIVDKKYIGEYPDNKLCVIVAGSQGQEGSSLVRAVFGEHRDLQLAQNDMVVFSADVIPGNEVPFYRAIDELARTGIEVIYPDIVPGVHQSGHASAPEQMRLVSLVRPEFVMPVGGADRHRALFRRKVNAALGYADKNILTPKMGEVLSFHNHQAKVAETISIVPKVVDGLGVGDVGPVVLSDRLSLSQAGIVVLVIPRHGGELQVDKLEVISRGFVFMKQADEVISFIKTRAIEIIDQLEPKSTDEDIKRAIERKLARRLYKVIQREPMIVATILDL
jgi:ribonuclease J